MLQSLLIDLNLFINSDSNFIIIFIDNPAMKFTNLNLKSKLAEWNHSDLRLF
jgi:hypothetical protein